MSFSTPLRYPGGKGRLSSYIAEVISLNNLEGGAYAEPFCGGAGIALSLLFSERVEHIYLNDADRSVYAFWHSAVHDNERLKKLIYDTPVNIEEWERQRAIQAHKYDEDLLDLGFSTFYLNRTNRSGIILGGVIGGKGQSGDWRIDARYNKEVLLERVNLIGYYSEDITVSNRDAVEFIRTEIPKMTPRTLVYFDPPYFKKGQKLYKNHFIGEDHAVLARAIREDVQCPWLVSYDNTPEISSLYAGCQMERFSLNYSAQGHYVGTELMIFKDGLLVPERVYASRAMLT